MRQTYWLIFLLIVIVTGPSFAQSGRVHELKPFATDGCSLWMDGTLAQPNLWRHCCVAHDLDYWQGGSKAQRQRSDERILACVKEAQGSGMANYMYKNILWGGSPYWMTTYRWGYGWNYLDGLVPRGYKTPTPEEQQLIDQAMPAALKVMAENRLQYPSILSTPGSQTSSAALSPSEHSASSAVNDVSPAK
jgi:hypothetical protein